MRFLVTGGAGFIGSRFIERILSDKEAQHSVVALVRNKNKFTSVSPLFVAASIERLKVITANLSDPVNLSEDGATIDVVLHFAGLTAALSKEDYIQNNVTATQNLLQAVKQYCPQVQQVIVLSSLAAAGPILETGAVRIESDLESPVSYYGISKLNAEKVCQSFAQNFPIVVIRPPIVYGPRDKGVLQLIQGVMRGVALKIRGPVRTYSAVHVDDLLDAIHLLIVSPEVSPTGLETYYVAHPEVFTLEVWMHTIHQALKRKNRLYFIHLPRWVLHVVAFWLDQWGGMKGRAFTLNKDKVAEMVALGWVCSPQKMIQKYGFHPKYNLKNGLEHTLKWYQEHQWL